MCFRMSDAPHASHERRRRAQSFPAHAGSCPPTASACGLQLFDEHAACMQGGVAATRQRRHLPVGRPLPVAARQLRVGLARRRRHLALAEVSPGRLPQLRRSMSSAFGSALRCMHAAVQHNAMFGLALGLQAANQAEQARCRQGGRPGCDPGIHTRLHRPLPNGAPSYEHMCRPRARPLMQLLPPAQEAWAPVWRQMGRRRRTWNSNASSTTSSSAPRPLLPASALLARRSASASPAPGALGAGAAPGGRAPAPGCSAKSSSPSSAATLSRSWMRVSRRCVSASSVAVPRRSAWRRARAAVGRWGLGLRIGSVTQAPPLARPLGFGWAPVECAITPTLARSRSAAALP